MDAPPHPHPPTEFSPLELRWIHQAIQKYCQILHLDIAIASHTARILTDTTSRQPGLRRDLGAVMAACIFIACRESQKVIMKFAPICALSRTAVGTGLAYLLRVEMIYYRLQGDTRYGKILMFPVPYTPGQDLSRIQGKLVVKGDYSTNDSQLREYCCERVVQGPESPDAVIAKDAEEDITSQGTSQNEVSGEAAAGNKKPDDADVSLASSDEDADWDFVSHGDLVDVGKDTQQNHLQDRAPTRSTGSWVGGLRRGLFG